jgi:uncharacterized protein with PIN domain
MFTRCTLCNDLLMAVQKEEIKELVPERVYGQQTIFKKCPSCGKVYWQGSHWDNVKETIAKLIYC